MKSTSSLALAKLAAKIADEKIGEDILVLDVRKESSLADFFIFVSGSNHIHIRAVEDAVREELRSVGAKLIRTDGQRGHLWRALDYGSLIVHIMDHKTREFYSLERLWERGKEVKWKKSAGSAAPKKKITRKRKAKN